ncbi:MAG TPA: 3-oxoacid CoA-transferase subunit A [Rubrivivax sp.]|jgi:3-oxoacid CoA-transferase A subunit|nr:3-oxoacid CoA-transferase subunit A [Burkholderiaceae bacterium]HMQ71985.1 3-oxoacid CoA-transferase subunit A [Rubrivivax sp.]HMR71101.1 3-oxoacid CoA-transferase subunit A [Rubrivivax sp.]
MDKVVSSVEEAIADIGDGAVVAIGGFFAAGVPRALLRALIRRRVRRLTLACGSGPLLGAPEELEELVANEQIAKVIDSYALFRSASKGLAHPFEQQVRAGRIELEIHPMGTLAEKYRAAGAGIPAFFVPTGAGSMVEDSRLTNVAEHREPKEVRTIAGRRCMLEYALQPDFALVHASSADAEGNLRYRKTARNFNHVMAMAARTTIAEVERIVPPGDPDGVHTAGVFVQRVVEVGRSAHPIPQL